MSESKKNRKFAFVEAKKVHPSRLLPGRELDPEVTKSVRRDGIQQPIIVRPSPYERGMYEIIDGHLRHKSVQNHEKVLVLIYYEVTDVEVFKISEATFKRKPRTTYERSLFYGKWVKNVEASNGKRGARSKVARRANLSHAEISHYLSIYKLFERLQSLNLSDTIFNALKNQGVNKLYTLARVEDETATLDVAKKMAETRDMTLEELKGLIEEQTSPMREIQKLLEDDEEDEVDESIRIDEVKKAALELEGTLNQTRKALTAFKSRLVGNPRKFISTDVFKRIRRMLKALKRIEKEAKRALD